MKRKQSFLLGNCLMVTGMAIMVISIAYNICNHVFQLDLPEYLAEISLISLSYWSFDLVSWCQSEWS
ncbi:DUF2583 family protein [Arsenophonus sp.]|uniref:DUF2583 family protein n=1 Tax=Arsenophonus sp. TaxID=1872640 RepID=UPI0038D3EEF9